MQLPNECPEDKCASLLLEFDAALNRVNDTEAVMEYTFSQWMEHQDVSIDACDMEGADSINEIVRRTEACMDAIEEANDRKEEYEEAMEEYGNALVDLETARDAYDDCEHACSAEEIQIIDED